MSIVEGYIIRNIVRQEKIPFELLSRVVQKILKITLAFATPCDCLPDLESKTLFLKTRHISNIGFGV